MFGPNLLRSEPDAVAEKLVRRGFKLGIDKLGALEERRRVLQVKTENPQAERNSRSKSIGRAKVRGEDIEPLRLEANKLGEELDTAEAELDALQAEIRGIVLTIPDLPADEVPVDKDENDSAEISHWDIPREFNSEVCDHMMPDEMHSGLDFVAIVKLTDSRFVVMRGQIARMCRVLSQFIPSLHTEQHSYSKNYVSYPVNRGTLYGVGQLLKFVGDLFHTRPLEKETDISDYALIPTAKAPLINLIRDGIIGEDDPPIRMTVHAPYFRSEAGSYGCNTRSLIRMHQFDKIRMVQIICPEDSMAALEEMIGHAEKVLQLLGLPYHEIIFYTGDMGFGACKTYDLEAWVPVQNIYREISSCSNVWDFQTRRMQARCRSKLDKKTRLVHTLNGSGLIVGRALIAVMGNYQQADGRIEIPRVLRPCMNGLEYIG